MFGPLHTAPAIESGIGQLMIPTAIQEIVFALWLIVKGFNLAAITALSDEMDTTAGVTVQNLTAATSCLK